LAVRNGIKPGGDSSFIDSAAKSRGRNLLMMLKNLLIGITMLFVASVAQAGDVQNAFIKKKSSYGVEETLDRLEAIVRKKGITVFTRVDHGGGAKKAGIPMTDTQLLIFGNPQVGTPLMNEQRLMGLDLPMKVLAWEDDKGQTWVAYTDPRELQRRHGLKNQALIDKMGKALDGMTNGAIGK
jgi:uncharacterized protein (DUF302 family)